MKWDDQPQENKSLPDEDKTKQHKISEELQTLRQIAIGEPLLSADEILKEIAQRRSGYEEEK